MKNQNEKNTKPSSPFHIQSIIGYNPKVSVVNLTNFEDDPKVAYASGHIVTILNCENEETEYLLGHEYEVVSIKTDEVCKVLVTSDKYATNIWERQFDKNKDLGTVLVKTCKSLIEDQPILATGLSVDGKYLVLVSRTYIQLWIWRNGCDKPDAILEMPDDFRIGNKITFCGCKSQSNSFVVTTDENLLFCRWNEQKKHLETHIPSRLPGISQIVDSSYCTNFCKGVSITNQGIAIVWSDTPPSTEFKHHLFDNRMEFQLKLKLAFYKLQTVSCCQGFVVISDSKGEVKIYDENLKFCFFCDLSGEIISSISFSKQGNETYKTICEPGPNKNWSNFGQFFVSCENGRIFKCNFNTRPTVITEFASDYITCFDVHPNKDLLCGGRSNGTVFLYDYTKNSCEGSFELSKYFTKSKSEHVAAKYLKFSSCSRYISAGMSNGCLSILNTVSLKPFQKPIQLSEADISIEKVIFSKTNEYIVYHDSYCTVGLLYFEATWKLLRKCRIHESPIIYMSFQETDNEIGLVTISEDYIVAEYTIRSVQPNDMADLSMNNCTKADFLSTLKSCIPLPLNIIAFPNVHCGNDQAFLATDENFKFHVRNFKSFEVMHTFAAPIAENREPITCSCHIHLKNENAVVFSTKRMIGLQHLPLDGNPNKFLAIVGHPRKIVDMKVSHCNNYLFTIGQDDQSVYMWKIRSSAVTKQYCSGRNTLKPYCNLIPEGVTGRQFTELQDLFFYMQIKSQKEKLNLRKKFQLIDGISVSDAIDFMRGVGFFPSETKIKSIIREIGYYANDSSMITFENLVKLFVNYKPPFGYLKSEIVKALKYLGSSYTSAETEIDRDRLVEICTSLGEEMSEADAATYLNRLDGRDQDAESDNSLFSSLRSVYTISEFMKYILAVE